jgi:hypothetical protein
MKSLLTCRRLPLSTPPVRKEKDKKNNSDFFFFFFFFFFFKDGSKVMTPSQTPGASPKMERRGNAAPDAPQRDYQVVSCR